MQQTALLTVFDILTFAVISGALGGVAYVGSNIKIRTNKILYEDEEAYFWPVLVILIASVVTGAASAVGLLFVFHFLQLLKPDATVTKFF